MKSTRSLALGRREPAELVQRLTLEQKVRLLTGADFWGLHGDDAVGLRRIVLSDGPVGVRGESLDERAPSANTPCPTAVAASWDPAVARAVGSVLGAEARRKGVDVVLSPVLNLQRSPFGGRHFECFSEDPLLTAQMGVAYIEGIQGEGVGACAKHFVANDSETERFTVDVRVDVQTLYEVYLVPFEAAVRQAGVWMVMASYNRVNGTTMTESPLLREVLHDEWGFDGVTVTDWFAGRSVAGAGNAALDVCMPGPESPWTSGLHEAVMRGAVPEKSVDDKVERVLTLAQRAGALGAVRATADHGSDAAQVLRQAAASGMVLVRNEHVDGAPLLPFASGAAHSLAVIGRHALAPRTMGGGSAQVVPAHIVSPWEGLRAACRSAEYAPGVRVSDRLQPLSADGLTAPSGGPGVEISYLNSGGDVLLVEDRRASTFLWIGDFGNGLQLDDVAEIEVRTRLPRSRDEDVLVGVASLGDVRMWIDGESVIEASLGLDGIDIVEAFARPPQAVAAVSLSTTDAHEILVRYRVPEAHGTFEAPPVCLLQLLFQSATSDEAELARAAEVAARADIAVVVVGTAEDESEGFDRTSLALPGRQDDLVRVVVEANPRTIVVVNSGAPVLLPWIEEVAAVVLAWFPGQEFGGGLADVLVGAVEPGGRLPVTWPELEADVLTTTPTDGALDYSEALDVGYRRYAGRGIVPAFPFGHGLGYTKWEWSVSSVELAADGSVTVLAELANVGTRAGSEVIQVYASRERTAVRRPALWLVGHARVFAEPGSAATAAIRIPRRAFEHYVAGAGWALEPGPFTLRTGRSSGDLQLINIVDPHGSAMPNSSDARNGDV